MRFVLRAAVDIRAAIDRVGHDLIQHGIGRTLPGEVSLVVADRQLQSFLDRTRDATGKEPPAWYHGRLFVGLYNRHRPTVH